MQKSLRTPALIQTLNSFKLEHINLNIQTNTYGLRNTVRNLVIVLAEISALTFNSTL